MRKPPLILGEALDLSGVEKPTVLTIGTAEPTEEWFDTFVANTNRNFGVLGANVVNLHEFGKMPSAAESEDKIAAADVIWVAGGNTKEMLRQWNMARITKELNKAALRGAVMSGGSAGMLAWMKQGHSDSLEYEVPEGEPWDYIFVPGLGMVNATGVPHFDSIKDGKVRGDDAKEKFALRPDLPPIGIGIDNMAALSLNNGQFRSLRIPGDPEFPRGQVHIFQKTENGVSQEPLPISDDYRPLAA